MNFNYDEEMINYISSKDKKMKYIISKIGFIKRECDDNIFASVLHHIIGQQISSSVQKTIWNRLNDKLKVITAQNLLSYDDEAIKSCGMTYKKVYYIKDFASKIVNGEFDLNLINNMNDEDAIKYLTTLKGIGEWTAEMILLFSLQRKNILSYDDLAIKRGIKMIYHYKELTKDKFEKIKKRLSPYGSVASLYIWHVAGNKCDNIRLNKYGVVIYEDKE